MPADKDKVEQLFTFAQERLLNEFIKNKDHDDEVFYNNLYFKFPLLFVNIENEDDKKKVQSYLNKNDLSTNPYGYVTVSNPFDANNDGKRFRQQTKTLTNITKRKSRRK
jgi:hypothetical protein